MKYRIIERNGRFEPQVRTLFVWSTIEDGYWQNKIICTTLEEARRKIIQHKSERKGSKFQVVYEE